MRKTLVLIFCSFLAGLLLVFGAVWVYCRSAFGPPGSLGFEFESTSPSGRSKIGLAGVLGLFGDELFLSGSEEAVFIHLKPGTTDGDGWMQVSPWLEFFNSSASWSADGDIEIFDIEARPIQHTGSLQIEMIREGLIVRIHTRAY
jgi:hypothetical protein